MKFMHLSDLHLGKIVNGFSMLEDQKYILEKIIEIAEEEKIDSLFIAGDIYDRSIAPVQALGLYDDFILKVNELGIETYIISGNHDSSERIAYSSELIEKSGVHIAGIFNGKIKHCTYRDAYGDVNIYLLPFIKKIDVKTTISDVDIDTYTDAVRIAVENSDIDFEKRNIILSHQFVTGASKSESEEFSVGGTDNVDAGAYDKFDYVALGHIHGPQNIGSERIRYSGTPLKYSFSEKDHTKTVTIGELKEKGNLEIKEIPLVPLRDMAELKGSYNELMSRDFYTKIKTDNYYRIILTDEEEKDNAMNNLRGVYEYTMEVHYENSKTNYSSSVSYDDSTSQSSPIDLLNSFYCYITGLEGLTEEQRNYAAEKIEKLSEGREEE